MRKPIYIVTVLLFLITACSKDADYNIEPAEEYAVIKIPQRAFAGKWIDEDNLESEQVIQNISLFLTEPDSDAFYYKAIRNVNYTVVDDYRLVHLPLPISTLGHKDIYVVTNLDNSSLSQVSTVAELKQMSTPMVSKSNNLDPQKGVCMFGKTLNFNFSNTSGTPAIVDAVRTCAKYRIKLTFPENPALSNQNAFIVLDAATNTTIGDDVSNTSPKGYFDFSVPIMLKDNGNGEYTNVTYVYEAEKAPRMGFYFNYKGNASVTPSYIITLPVPQRNYLYELDVQVYDTKVRSVSRAIPLSSSYACKTSISVYNLQGEKVE